MTLLTRPLGTSAEIAGALQRTQAGSGPTQPAGVNGGHGTWLEQGSTRHRSKAPSRGWCCPRIGANGLRLGGGLRGSLLGSPYQRVGDRFHDRLLVRPDRGTRFPL